MVSNVHVCTECYQPRLPKQTTLTPQPTQRVSSVFLLTVNCFRLILLQNAMTGTNCKFISRAHCHAINPPAFWFSSPTITILPLYLIRHNYSTPEIKGVYLGYLFKVHRKEEGKCLLKYFVRKINLISSVFQLEMNNFHHEQPDQVCIKWSCQ